VIPAASFAGDRLHEFELVGRGPNAHLEPLPWSPLPLTGLMLFGGAAATPDGERVYQMGYSNSFRGFALGADGSLTPLNLQAAEQGQLTNAAVSPDGRQLYCTRDTHPDFVVGYSIAPSGGLSELPSSPFVLPASSSFPSHIVLSPNGQFVVAGSSGGNAVTVMRRQQDGQLVISAGGALVLGGAPGAVACDDEHLFVLGNDTAGVAHVFVFELANVQSGPTHAAVVPTGARDLTLAPPAGS
jgi:6-phosphogluconolactonase (cycloisomerase 2 family)